MPDRLDHAFQFERIGGRSIVSLKTSRTGLHNGPGKWPQAGPLAIAGNDPQSLWLGPDRWLLVSDSMSPDAIIESCSEELAGQLHNAVDYSAGLAAFRIAGRNARRVLASGTGVDLRPDKFPDGTCCRTQLAQVAAVIVAEADGRFAVYVDRSYEFYLANWLAELSGIHSSLQNSN